MLVFFVVALWVQDALIPSHTEVELLQACIADAPARQVATQCRGLVSGPCINTREGGTTTGMIFCLRREIAIWDDKINSDFNALQEELVEADFLDRAQRLQESQGAWVIYRDLECSQRALAIIGTLAGVVASGCHLDLTSARAAALYDQLRELRYEL